MFVFFLYFLYYNIFFVVNNVSTRASIKFLKMPFVLFASYSINYAAGTECQRNRVTVCDRIDFVLTALHAVSCWQKSEL